MELGPKNWIVISDRLRAVAYLIHRFYMSKQRSAYFLITVSFVMGMIATTSISGCDSGKKEAATSAAPKSSLDGEGASQIQLDKPAESAATEPPAEESPAAQPTSQEPPAPESGSSESPAAPAASGN